jgi:hypothetical protein
MAPSRADLKPVSDRYIPEALLEMKEQLGLEIEL